MANIIKQVATDYNLNKKALKRFVKESGLKPKVVTRLEVLEIVYTEAPSLFFTRADEYPGIVEYLDTNLNIRLCSEMRELREGELMPKIL